MPLVTVASKTNMTATFQIKFENDTAPITFNAALPIYENYLLAGYSYKYDMMLKMDTILFDDVYIVDWVNVNVDNTPIIPSGEN